MFANVGWGEMLILVIAGLVILGPERLPGAIRWTAGTVKQYANIPAALPSGRGMIAARATSPSGMSVTLRRLPHNGSRPCSLVEWHSGLCADVDKVGWAVDDQRLLFQTGRGSSCRRLLG